MRKNSSAALRNKGSDLDIPPMTRAQMRRGVMGKYAPVPGVLERIVELDQDVARDFPTSRAVNEGLRKLREIQRLIEPEPKKKTA